MQDDNTVQPNDNNTAGAGDAEENVIEPTLGLGTNPTDQPATDTAAPADNSTVQPAVDDEGAVPEIPIAETGNDTESVAEETTEAEGTESDTSISSDPGVSGDLESIKSSALHDLAPIVSELDQEPEEKYRTLMMMIQASDDQSLIKDAYDAAGKIEDNKLKAEALLTIVNEINYLTGKDKSQPED